MLCIKIAFSHETAFKSLFLLGLVMTLALGHADGAAARSGVESVVVPLEHPAAPTRLLVAPTRHQVEDTILIQAVDLGFLS